MVKEIKNARQNAKKVAHLIGELQAALAAEAPDDDAVRTNYRKLVNTMARLHKNLGSDLAGPAGAESLDTRGLVPVMAVEPPVTEKPGEVLFDDFFESITGSVVEAQKRLDRHSLDYIRSTEHTPHVLPSLFRLPSVTAEFKFALEEIKGKKLNLAFYSKGTQATRMNQQSVRFDLKSVPPPPEVVQAIRGSAPQPRLVLAPSERRRVFDALPTEAKLPISDRDRALIAETDVGNKVLIVLANADAQDPRVGCWSLELPAADDEVGKLSDVIDFGDMSLPRERIQRIQAFLLELIRKQKTFLVALAAKHGP